MFLEPTRRHTYYFLAEAKRLAAVYLTTEVDISKVEAVRERWNKDQRSRIGLVAMTVKVLGSVLAKYPEANAYMAGLLFPRVHRQQEIVAKVTIDKRTERGKRLVASATIPLSESISELEIQRVIDSCANANFDTDPTFKPIRLLQATPIGFGQLLFRFAIFERKRRARLLGTFSVTSLGRYPVQFFFPQVVHTLTLGVGHSMPKPVVIGGQVVVRSMLPITLAFDHRVIDGGMAGEILEAVKTGLEDYLDVEGMCCAS